MRGKLLRIIKCSAHEIAGKEAFWCQQWEIACKEAFGVSKIPDNDAF